MTGCRSTRSPVLPLTIFQIPGKNTLYYGDNVIDGHHRLAIYRESKWNLWMPTDM